MHAPPPPGLEGKSVKEVTVINPQTKEEVAVGGSKQESRDGMEAVLVVDRVELGFILKPSVWSRKCNV